MEANITAREMVASTLRDMALDVRRGATNTTAAAAAATAATAATTSTNNVSDDEEIYDESFINISSNESSFIIESPKKIREDALKCEDYILSMFEIGDLTENNNGTLVQVDSFLSIEERMELSSINFINNSHMEVNYYTFSAEFSMTLNEMRRSLSRNTEVDINYNKLDKVEKSLLRYVHSIYDTNKKVQNLSYSCPYQLFNTNTNKERDFIAKSIYPMIFGVLNDTSLFFYQEVTSNVFANCKLPIVYCKHDFIFVDKYGLEIGTCEVKPQGASSADVVVDICRIAESTKRQLRQRIMQAKSEKEIITFGIMFNGYDTIFYTQTLESGKYLFKRVGTATLPALPSLFSHMEDFLEKLFFFRNLIVSSPCSDVESPVITSDYTFLLKTTLCKLSNE